MSTHTFAPVARPGRTISRLLVLFSALLVAFGVSAPVSAHSADVTTGWWLEIPTARIGAEVFVGGQTTIDSGHATLFDGWGFTVEPGQPGTTWIAGHRTSRGAIFRRLPRLQVGQTVNIWTADALYTYRISERAIVGPYGDSALMFGDDPNVNRLVLQCSWTKGRALMVAGNLESVTPLV